MRTFSAVAAAILLGTLPIIATAQDSSDAPADQSADGLSLGSPDSNEPQVGQTYVAEIFTDWDLRCIKTESGEDPCQLYQLLRDEEGNAVAEFSLFTLPEGQEAAGGATVITPLETLLTEQLRLSIDDGEGKIYPYSFCTQVGCFARIGLLASEIEDLKRGNVTNVTITAAGAPDQPLNLTLSLSGFTAGWDRLVELGPN